MLLFEFMLGWVVIVYCTSAPLRQVSDSRLDGVSEVGLSPRLRVVTYRVATAARGALPLWAHSDLGRACFSAGQWLRLGAWFVGYLGSLAVVPLYVSTSWKRQISGRLLAVALAAVPECHGLLGYC